MIENLLEGNKKWAARINAEDPQFFEQLAKQQTPEYLWIGCADSRVPANQITDLLPGEVFVHRNIANLVVHTDINCLSVLQYAVEVLKVKHIIVCGHYGCGGVKAALEDVDYGLIDNWIRHIKDTVRLKSAELEKINDEGEKWNRLVEFNVMEQVQNLGHTTVIQQAWGRGQEVSVHGWVYSLKDGILNDLGITLKGNSELKQLS